MPQLTARGISVEILASISKPLVEELADICKCGTDNFTVDCLNVVSVFDGQVCETFPFIEVAWFERGSEARDRIAEAITRYVRSVGILELEIAFKVYREDGYYVGGVPCG
ncbi:DUF1904 family protein [Paenibacillus allorhizosphaerae]|uniref:DUF1904 family protein n=1 Tax=Paenibacillus allorhizosphaerae TaxID=2849866 RepID=A0ABM8VB43_9BACL|nr:DUF1904 family protein [Paenibacillus allorhizosphaerae]CAG7618273.1 hypothetical protein PAECIP111802_00502 [Paenibacillus allorhizosphaerae]